MSTPKLGEKRYLALKAKLPLDLLAVDEELSEIAVYIQEAGEFCAQAIEERDAAATWVDRVEAEVADKLRKTPDENGKVPSEANIKARLALQPELQEAQFIAGQAKLGAALWLSMQDSLKTKSYSINTAAELVKAGYMTRDHILDKRRSEIGQMRQPVHARPQVK
jgi:hypothetical protein